VAGPSRNVIISLAGLYSEKEIPAASSTAIMTMVLNSTGVVSGDG